MVVIHQPVAIASDIAGPRLGRFNRDGYVIEFPANSPSFQVLGTVALWFGWYGALHNVFFFLFYTCASTHAGFNPGSTGCFYGCMLVASRVAVNTTLSAATGGLTVLFLSLFLGRPGDIGPMLNGIITALVAITSSCAMVYPYAAVIIGMVRCAALYKSLITAFFPDCRHGVPCGCMAASRL